MKFKITFNPEVQFDIQEAIIWYNEQQQGLGTRFLAVIKKHFKSLKVTADHYAIRYDDIRCMPIKRFPYMVHYRIDYENKMVKVEALFHTSRDPKKWHQRNR